jgi:hypothetical protein
MLNFVNGGNKMAALKPINNEIREMLLKKLDKTVAEFMHTYHGLDAPDDQVNAGWTAAQILRHVTFWHESFARNVLDLVSGRKPKPLKGKYRDLTQLCFDSLGDLPDETILIRLDAAQKTIRDKILNSMLGMIPYIVGSRDYSPEEHLGVVEEHVRGHLQDIQKMM